MKKYKHQFCKSQSFMKRIMNVGLGLFLFGGILVTSNQTQAADLTIFSGAVGNDTPALRAQLDIFEERTGNKVTIANMPSSTTDQLGLMKTYLSAKASDIDVYRTDVIWAPEIANHLVDLKQAVGSDSDNYFPAIIESQTVDGRLVALPLFTDAPVLFYRTDLLEKYNREAPNTWDELYTTAKFIQTRERAEGNTKLWGFVFQGKGYEGLTCDALEWIKSNGGGQIVEPDGTISINNQKAILAIDKIKRWIGDISPPGVLSYQEEDSRAVWQTGNAIFMRNWPYAYSLSNNVDSAVAGKFDVKTLPAGDSGKSAATLGGWNLAVSKYSENQDAATELVLFLSSVEMQKNNATVLSKLPTRIALYEDADVRAASPFFPSMVDVFLNAVPRPSAPTKLKYSEVSKSFYQNINSALSGRLSAKKAIENIEKDLKRTKGKGW